MIAERVEALLPGVVAGEHSPTRSCGEPGREGDSLCGEPGTRIETRRGGQVWDISECQHVVVAMDCETRWMALDEMQDQG